MSSLLSGLFLVIAATTVVYAIDAAASSERRPSLWRRATFTLAGVLGSIGLALLVAGWDDGGTSAIIGVSLILAGLVAALAVPVRVRRATATVLPLDEGSARDWIGLVGLIWLVIARIALFYAVENEVGEVRVAEAAMQMILLVSVAFAMVGLFVRRGWRQSMQRLGIAWTGFRTIGLAALIVIPFAVSTAMAVYALDTIQPGTLDRLDEAVTDITGGQSSLGFGLLLGISAAVGEETLFRGAIQPRYGLLLTSLIFALLHVQYDIGVVLASLLPAGIILGLERRHLGTTAAIVTHALYNALAVVASG